jgi:hypothetical protein
MIPMAARHPVALILSLTNRSLRDIQRSMKNKDSEAIHAVAPKASLFNVHHLGVLKWLLEAPDGERRFVVQHGTTTKYFETEGLDERGKRPVRRLMKDSGGAGYEALCDTLRGRFEVDLFPLVAKGLLLSFRERNPASGDGTYFAEKVADIAIPGKWPSPSACFELSNSASGWWETSGHPRYEKLAGKHRQREAAVRRLAVFGRVTTLCPPIAPDIAAILPERCHLPMPRHTVLRPMVAATVVKETPRRYAVVDVRPINGQSGSSVVSGHVEQHVERQYLLLDNVSEAELEAISEFDRAHVASVEAAATAAAQEIAPVLRRLADRMKQKEAEHVAGFAELFGALRSARSNA